MSNKVNGLWAVNSDGVFMFFNSVDSPSVWRFVMSGDVESWRMVPGVVNAQAVRGVVLCRAVAAHSAYPPMYSQQFASTMNSSIGKTSKPSRSSSSQR